MVDNINYYNTYNTFEEIRRVDEEGNEYWMARTLSRVLDYSEFRHFQHVIEKAREACKLSGYIEEDHFEDTLDMVDIGSGARRGIPDIRLSRYGCYLIVQNGDPSKPVIANGQTPPPAPVNPSEALRFRGFYCPGNAKPPG